MCVNEVSNTRDLIVGLGSKTSLPFLIRLSADNGFTATGAPIQIQCHDEAACGERENELTLWPHTIPDCVIHISLIHRSIPPEASAMSLRGWMRETNRTCNRTDTERFSLSELP